MGGAYGEGNVTPAAEFNIWVDPEAAERVFQSGLDVTMIGLDVSHQAIFGPEPTARIRAAGRVGAMVAELLEFYGAVPQGVVRVGRLADPRRGRDGARVQARDRRDGPRRREGRLRRGARSRPHELRPPRAGGLGAERARRRSASMRTRSSRSSSSASPRSVEARSHHAPVTSPWPELVDRWRTWTSSASRRSGSPTTSAANGCRRVRPGSRRGAA